MADHLSRKTVTGIAGMTGLLHPSDIPHPGHPPVNLTVPPDEPQEKDVTLLEAKLIMRDSA